MAVISNNPFIECVSRSEIKDRLDIHFYRPDLRINTKDLEALPDLISLKELILDKYPISSGATPKGANYLESGMPFLRVQNVRPMNVSFDDIVFISKETHKELKRSIILEGDVLLTITGATFGYSAVYQSEEYTEANVNQHIARIRIDGEKVIPNYFALFLNSNMGYCQSLRYSTGGSRPALDFGAIKQFLIPCPSKSKQKVIIDRFEGLKIQIDEIFERASALLKKRHCVSKEFDRILSTNSTNYSQTIDNKWSWGLSKDSLSVICTKNQQCAIIREVPERLDPRFALPNRLRKIVFEEHIEWALLGDYAKIDRISFQSDASLCHIAIDEMPNDPWERFQAAEGYSGSTVLLENGDIAISRLMPTIMNGKCFIAWDKMTGSAEFIRVRTEEKLQRIILFWLKSALVREFLLGNVRGSSASQKRFTEEDLKNLPIPKTIMDNPGEYLPACEDSLSNAFYCEQQSYDLQSKADNLLTKAKSNIFNLLDDRLFSDLVAEVKETLR